MAATATGRFSLEDYTGRESSALSPSERIHSKIRETLPGPERLKVIAENALADWYNTFLIEELHDAKPYFELTEIVNSSRESLILSQLRSGIYTETNWEDFCKNLLRSVVKSAYNQQNSVDLAIMQGGVNGYFHYRNRDKDMVGFSVFLQSIGVADRAEPDTAVYDENGESMMRCILLSCPKWRGQEIFKKIAETINDKEKTSKQVTRETTWVVKALNFVKNYGLYIFGIISLVLCFFFPKFTLAKKVLDFISDWYDGGSVKTLRDNILPKQ